MSERHRLRRGVQTVWQLIRCVERRPQRAPFRSRHLGEPGRRSVVVHDAVHELRHQLPLLCGDLFVINDHPSKDGSEPSAFGCGAIAETRTAVATGSPAAEGANFPTWPTGDPDGPRSAWGATETAGAGANPSPAPSVSAIAASLVRATAGPRHALQA